MKSHGQLIQYDCCRNRDIEAPGKSIYGDLQEFICLFQHLICQPGELCPEKQGAFPFMKIKILQGNSLFIQCCGNNPVALVP